MKKYLYYNFDSGGTMININVLDKKTIINANKNPDLYPNLVARVSGFTSCFSSLLPEFRQLVVDGFLNK